MLTTTVPVMVDHAAAAFLNESGLRPDFDRLLDYTLQAVPRLRALHVTFSPYYEDGSEETVRFNATVAVTADEALAAEDEWMKWTMAHFPFDVTRRFILFANPGAADAG
jgi:hypothetical protein